MFVFSLLIETFSTHQACNYKSKMINLYWPVYKNLEKELLELSNHVHFDDNQLSIYSVRISELLIRCSVEIEAISKDLFFKLGGTEPDGGDLYFDTHCLQLVEDNWQLSKKKIVISAPNFYFQKEENRVLTPLYKANKRGTSSSKWKQAYQAVKHNRTINLKEGNIKNLLNALAALYILNIYFKDETYNLGKNGSATNFPINLGSDLFATKLHPLSHYDSKHNYGKKEDFEECIYFTKYTEEHLQKSLQATKEMQTKQIDMISKHPKFLEYIKSNNITDYTGNNFMYDILGAKEYQNIVNSSIQPKLDVLKNAEYEAVLNKNNI